MILKQCWVPVKADISLEGEKDEGLLKSPEPQNGIRAKVRLYKLLILGTGTPGSIESE